jgi:signal transduction histidine kinase
MNLGQALTQIVCVSAILKHLRALPLAIYAILIVGCGNLVAQTNLIQVMGTLTNAWQVRQINFTPETPRFLVRLEGTVLWVSPTRDRLVLQDKSGGVVLRMDLRKRLEIRPGQKVLVEGDDRNGMVPGPLIDNDGLHVNTEKPGMLYFSAGMHPISVEWFNNQGDFELEVDCMGPQMPRQKIPTAILYRGMRSIDNNNLPVHGLDYSCYEGNWSWLPDFSQLLAVTQGFTTNFDLQVRTRDTYVGMVFSGYFDAPQSGEYSFWLKSDDGSKLYIDDQPLQISDLGKSTLPAPCQIIPGQPIPKDREYQWSQVEGIVTHINKTSGGFTSIELTSDTGRAYLKVISRSDDYLKLLLHCGIKATGVSQNACDVDGQVVSSLLLPDTKQIAIVEMASEHWADLPVLPIRSLIETNFPEAEAPFVHVVGTVVSNSIQGYPVIKDETGKILIEAAQVSSWIGEPVEALGEWSRAGSNVVLRDCFYREASSNRDGNPASLPLLSKIIQVKSLSRMEAMRGYPVKVQGVITARVGIDFVIQDSTWSIFCYPNEAASREEPRVGEYWEVEGKSSVDFAPNIIVSHAERLWPGILPEPLHPTKDELINGSLDTQYIEVRGIAVDADTNDLTLLTQHGTVELQLDDVEAKIMKEVEGALIRVRGVSSPPRDTNQMMLLPTMPQLRLFNASVIVDEPAPQYPFDFPLKHVSDLLHFDVRANNLRRVKVAGQILHERNGEYFLMDGPNGLRFEPKKSVDLRVGDMVEVVGFLDLSRPSPILREAAVRVTGNAALPAARRLSNEGLLSGQLDSTLVQIKSLLVGLRADRADQILELQVGNRSYVARSAQNHGIISDLLPGSTLDITGVYAGQGGGLASSRDIDSFELLLNSPLDIRVIARPSWWTFRHTSAVIGMMALVMLTGMVWITQLNRQVRRQTSQLAIEIKNREQAEYQRALEKERTRIASDLHDELGATLTEIHFLGAVKSRDLSVPQATRSRLIEVSDKSHQMISSLDEIVWAVNPANDSVPNLAAYLRHVAEEFSHTTEIHCRLDVDPSLPPLTLTSESRHNVYLVVREALNNIAKHSKATEAWLRIHWKEDALQIIVEDNGCGFSHINETGNGLSNMRCRIEKIGGHFEYDSRLGLGTSCRICLPLISIGI